jgi:glycosyltransferase involved in cell wall biosynthesis
VNVLLLCEFSTLNGGENSALSTFSHLRAADVQLTVAAPASGDLAQALNAQSVELLPLDFRDSAGSRRSQAESRQQLEALLRRRRPDLLHANSLSMGRLAGPVAAEMQLPSISHLRDIIGLSAGSIADLNRHRRLLAVSAATRSYHLAQGLDANKTHVLYNGVDLARFRPRPASGWLRSELSLGPEALLVGTIGQLVMRKGHDVLVQAAARLASRFPELHYIFIGSRYSEKAEAHRYEADLHAAFAQPDLAGRGHFLGCREGIEDLLPELSLLVHPARQEPLGRVLLEGAAAGAAIIATDIGGTREIFPQESGAAILVPPNSAEALAEAITSLAEDAGARSRLSRAARRRAEEAFDINIAAANLIRHYREVLDS